MSQVIPVPTGTFAPLRRQLCQQPSRQQAIALRPRARSNVSLRVACEAVGPPAKSAPLPYLPRLLLETPDAFVFGEAHCMPP